MSKKPVPLSVEVYINSEWSVDLVKRVRAKTGLPISLITEEISCENSIYAALLIPEHFYAGVHQLVEFLHALDASAISYAIYANGGEIDKGYLEKLKYDVDHLGLQNFR